MHLLDTTLFYSPTSGGVKRYLTAKHAWLAAHTSWEHTIVVPGAHDSRRARRRMHAVRLPGAGHVQLPAAAQPAPLGESHACARADAHRGRRRLSSGLVRAPRGAAPRHSRSPAFYHSNLPQIIGRRFGGALTEPGLGRYVRWLYEGFDVVFAPSRLMCAYLNDIGVQHTMLQPLGRGRRGIPPAAPHRHAARAAGAGAPRRACSSTPGASPRRRTCRCCCRRLRA